MSVKTWITELLTGADNKTPDPARHGWLFANVAVLIAAIIQAVHNSTIPLIEFATALGIVNGSGAASTMATKSSQPKPKEHTDASISTTVAGPTQTTSVEVDTSGTSDIVSPD